MTSARGYLGSIFLLALALSISGCGGESPLSPAPPSGNNNGGAASDGPQILMITEDQTVRYVKLAANLVDGTGAAATSRAIHVSAVIDGDVGGRLRCGRFLLAVPPGTFEGEGTISMSMPDSTLMVVDLEISPGELNDFKEDVQLCLLTDGTRLTEGDLEIYWWNAKVSTWEATGCNKDLSDDAMATATDQGILTHLTHFSRYSGGKAGW